SKWDHRVNCYLLLSFPFFPAMAFEYDGVKPEPIHPSIYCISCGEQNSILQSYLKFPYSTYSYSLLIFFSKAGYHDLLITLTIVPSSGTTVIRSGVMSNSLK